MILSQLLSLIYETLDSDSLKHSRPWKLRLGLCYILRYELECNNGLPFRFFNFRSVNRQRYALYPV